MVTKNQFIQESVFLLGEYNNLTKLVRPTRKMLKEVALEEGILLDIEQRVALKRVLRARKVKFADDISSVDLVQLAIAKKINFDKLGDGLST
jgi:hypothetical protein